MTEIVLDPAVLKALPVGAKVIYICKHGRSNWSEGYRVDIEVDGDERELFLKVCYRSQHVAMARGEYESQKALAQHLPDNTAAPLAWNTFELDPTRSFFLTTYRELSKDRIPNPSELIEILAKLHKSSVSPTGKFGFHVTTFNGHVPLINDWTDSWEEWFSRQLRSDIEWEQTVRGVDAEFNEVVDQFFQKVIPRLLRPLQSGGRSIKPVLVHGDLWPGNAQIDRTSNRLILFDSCCCYAHNEMELHMMRQERYEFKKEYVNAYTIAVKPSEPKEDFEDRNILYAMRDDMINSGLHDHRAHLRGEVKQEMLRLLAKHPNGIDGFKEPTRAKGIPNLPES
ncbi:hypothetical protein VTL71DRAFT_5353 [Oculimacula yallundae]|uniref:protein-ribulosamine 3-kinase n=1 Tax=Oculimacula yallundae TaxID=86028 RepID=A0ABR4C3E0_9HELO